MSDSENMFEELVKKFHIKYGRLQIQGYHGLAQDPRKMKSVSPASFSRFVGAHSNLRKQQQRSTLAPG